MQDVHFARLEAVDVVRHQLVSDIVTAYGRWEQDSAHARDKRARDAARAGSAASREAGSAGADAGERA